MRNCKSLGVVTVVAALFSGGGAWGQVDIGFLFDASSTLAESPGVGLQFNFANPGARSLGLGGAFVAMADDATAAFANPAGVVQLSRQEVSLEFRSNEFSSQFPSRGHAFGDPSGFGFDTVPGIEFSEDSSDTTGISFLSYVYPVRPGLAIAVYRHELANFLADFQSEGMYYNVPIPIAIPGFPRELGKGSVPLRLSPSNNFLELQIDNIGLSAAWRVRPDLSLGVGVSFYDFTLESRTENFEVVHFLVDPGDFDRVAFDAIPFFSPAGAQTFSPDNLQATTVQQGDDDDIGINAGLLWNLHSHWTLGAAFRQGGKFDFSTSTVRGPQGEDLILPPDQQASFHVPDVYTIGVSFRPSPVFRFALDYSRVEYSNLTEKPGAPPFGLTEDEIDIDDADEAHLGIEYVFVDLKYPVAIRVGGWNDPDHRVRFARSFDTPLEPGSAEDQFAQQRRFRAAAVLLQEGPNELHYSLGLGIVVGEKFQFDAAVDLSELVDTFSFSGVFRF